MPTVRFALSEAYYEKLKKDADEAHLNIQDYIRRKLFQIENPFTVEEAAGRIQKQGKRLRNQTFTLPDVYGEDWTLERGPAGVFGKNFFQYIESHPELGIRFAGMGKYGRRAEYTYQKEEDRQ